MATQTKRRMKLKLQLLTKKLRHKRKEMQKVKKKKVVDKRSTMDRLRHLPSRRPLIKSEPSWSQRRGGWTSLDLEELSKRSVSMSSEELR